MLWVLVRFCQNIIFLCECIDRVLRLGLIGVNCMLCFGFSKVGFGMLVSCEVIVFGIFLLWMMLVVKIWNVLLLCVVVFSVRCMMCMLQVLVMCVVSMFLGCVIYFWQVFVVRLVIFLKKEELKSISGLSRVMVVRCCCLFYLCWFMQVYYVNERICFCLVGLYMWSRLMLVGFQLYGLWNMVWLGVFMVCFMVFRRCGKWCSEGMSVLVCEMCFWGVLWWFLGGFFGGCLVGFWVMFFLGQVWVIGMQCIFLCFIVL